MREMVAEYDDNSCVWLVDMVTKARVPLAHGDLLTVDPTSRWRYPLGTVVHWCGRPEGTQPWVISHRCVTEGDADSYAEYFVRSQGNSRLKAAWACEDDLREVQP